MSQEHLHLMLLAAVISACCCCYVARFCCNCLSFVFQWSHPWRFQG